MRQFINHGLCLLAAFSAFFLHAETLQFRAALGSPASQFTQALLTEAYQRLAIETEFIEVPFGRSLVESNRGNLAGELARVLKVTEQYKNLLPVPYILFDTEVILYTNAERCPDCSINQVQSLVYVRGSLVVEDMLRTLPASRQVISVGTIEAAVQMFFEGKVDGVVFAAYRPEQLPPFAVNQQLLGVLPDYHLLHKQHQALIPLLTQILRELEADGTTMQLRQQFKVTPPLRQLKNAEVPFAQY